MQPSAFSVSLANKWAGRIVIIIAVLVLYGQTIFFGFIPIDDYSHIVENPILQNSSASFLQFWQEPYFGLYIPVTYSVWALVFEFTRPYFADSTVAHSLNVVLHALNGLLVFGLLRFMLKPLATTFTNALSLLGAIWFVINPQQVETVAWASSFKDILSAFFILWMLHWALIPRSAVTGVWKYSLLTLLFFMAILSKPGAISWSLFLVFFAFSRKEIHFRWKIIFSGIWAVLSLSVIYITSTIQSGSALWFKTPSIIDKIFVAVDTIAFYSVKQFSLINHSLDYGRTPAVALANPMIYGLFFALLAGIIGISLLARKSPILFAMVAAWMIPILPVLGIISFSQQAQSTVTDRYTYLIHASTGCLLAYIAAQIFRKVSWRGFFRLVCISVLLLFGAASSARIRHWSDPTRLLDATLRVNPQSTLAQAAYGDYFRRQHNWLEAALRYESAVKISSLPMHFANAGGAYIMAQQFDRAAQILEEGLRLHPDFEPLKVNLEYAQKMLARP